MLSLFNPKSIVWCNIQITKVIFWQLNLKMNLSALWSRAHMLIFQILKIIFQKCVYTWSVPSDKTWVVYRRGLSQHPQWWDYLLDYWPSLVLHSCLEPGSNPTTRLPSGLGPDEGEKKRINKYTVTRRQQRPCLLLPLVLALVPLQKCPNDFKIF